MDYQIVQLEAFDVICLKRLLEDYKDSEPMWKAFHEQKYWAILSKYSPYTRGKDPNGTGSDADRYLYTVTIDDCVGCNGDKCDACNYSESRHYYCIGTVYNGKDFSEDNKFSDPLEIINIKAGKYFKVVRPPGYANVSDFIADAYKKFDECGYEYENEHARPNFNLTHVDNETDFVVFIATK